MEKQPRPEGRMQIKRKSDWLAGGGDGGDGARAPQSPPRERGGRLFADKLTRNVALASAALLCCVALRAAKTPESQSVFSTFQAAMTETWDETLGRLTFVTHLLPESTLVFFETPLEERLLIPCMGVIAQGYSDGAPYLTFAAESASVTAAAAGEVMSIAHGNDEERIVRIRHESGLESVYGNLDTACVAQGDAVAAGQKIGEARAGTVYLEVRRNGRPIDPTALLAGYAP